VENIKRIKSFSHFEENLTSKQFSKKEEEKKSNSISNPLVKKENRRYCLSARMQEFESGFAGIVDYHS